MLSKEALREEWKQRVQEWQASGKSCQQWAKENNCSYHSLLYWRGKYSKVEPTAPPKSSFVELADSSTSQSGIFLEVSGVTVHIDRAFDPLTLTSCINLLKKLAC